MERELLDASMKGDLRLVSRLLVRGYRPNVKDNDGWTYLHFAASKGRLEIVEPLIEHGAVLNVKNNVGETPLHLAAQNGYLELVKVLLAQKFDPNVKNNVGETSLHLAAQEGYLELVKVLLENEGNLNVKDNDGWTPLYHAAREGRLKVFEFLIDRRSGGLGYQSFLDNLDRLIKKYPEKEEKILGCLVILLLPKLKILFQTKSGTMTYFKIMDNLFPCREKIITDQELYEMISLGKNNDRRGVPHRQTER